MSGQYLQIGEVADRVGLSLRTVRYYEEMGLVVPADRSGGGFRLYTEGQVERLLLIKQMKPLGFSVQEIGDLLAATDVLADPDAGDAAYDEASDRLRAFSSATDERVTALREQLERAEDFARQLQQRTRRRRRSAARGA